MIDLLSNPLSWLRRPAPGPGRVARRQLARIREYAGRLTTMRDDDLASSIAELRREKNSSDRDRRVFVFALTSEAIRRVLQVELYDVQILGALALVDDAIAEMQTGEGKTFTAVLPAVWHALGGRGVHVMTVNTYLAERDFQELSPVYRLLGLSVGLISAGALPAVRRAAYDCDVTYGPGYEFGFDYLRDQLLRRSQRKPGLGESLRRRKGDPCDEPLTMQRGQVAAIVDEADSVMIDEATTPLIISSGGTQPAHNAEVFRAAHAKAVAFVRERDFTIDEAASALSLTPAGAERLVAESDDIPHRRLDRPWLVYVEQALRARYLFHRDVHYVVEHDAVQIVDQYTGRIFSDRSWRDGLHQAVQAKESVSITSETNSIARITRQRYFQLYEHVCGMTGTAQGCANELRDIYGLPVVVIPPHRPCRREVLSTRLFQDRPCKEEAIVDEIVRIRQTGRPVLLGTAAIETSERLANLLRKRGVSCQILNGKQDADEASVVAQAGLRGALTIATNMAGRGTDIKLGDGVAKLGGLHVMAAESQESTRVDRQLVGRAARQGDPGSCQLFVSAEDPLLVRFGQALAEKICQQPATHGEILNPADLSQRLVRLQRAVEMAQAEHRRQLMARDEWMDGVLDTLCGAD